MKTTERIGLLPPETRMTTNTLIMKKWNNPDAYPISDLIIYKNNQLIAFNKPPELAVQQRDQEEKALINLAEIYAKSKVYLIHRLDRPASGIVLMAKNIQAQTLLTEQFKAKTIQKKYLAVVKEAPEPEEGELIHFLKKNQKVNKSFPVEEDASDAKKAVMKYKLLGKSDQYHLLEIDLITGRHHQIRAQLSAIGHPVKGDVKYGFKRKNQDRSIHLHAWQLAFDHPVTEERILLKAPPLEDPVWDAFKELIDKR